MATTISYQTDESLFLRMMEQVSYPDPEDAADVMIPLPPKLGRGQMRSLNLREDMTLKIETCEQFDDLTIIDDEASDWLRVGFHLSGIHHNAPVTVCPGEYSLMGSGVNPCNVFHSPAGLLQEVSFEIAEEAVQSFFGELPTPLQGLMRSSDRAWFAQTYRTTAAMQVVLHQILQCPYRGVLKRRYLETKVWELLLLSVEPLLAESPSSEKLPKKLKPEQVDRIHVARNILLQRLENPPSISELARLVGLNTRMLKEGFRECFGTTAFHYLHHYRLDQAQQLLLATDLRVEDVAQQIGFKNRSYFAAAFRKKFGLNPGEYSRQHQEYH
ncbi:MAG: helix-turn-helix transcriptional regulator [Leptolyngbyaceae cyanobacterium SU_3_3]|nr:helix-turn-helix transcriptional regulator [Leptolyngbyaceae cyanobacterium SU_3_3]